jgi:hypothetical protein
MRTKFLIVALIAMAMCACSTQKKVSAVEAVSTSDNSTHSLSAESASLDSVFRSLTIELDSLYLEVETQDSVPRRMRLQAKRASIGAQSRQITMLDEVVVIADSTASQANNNREVNETSAEVAIAKPPDISLIIIIAIIIAAIGGYILYRHKFGK